MVYTIVVETTSQNISDLAPEQRQAAEKLLGRPLVNFQKVVVRVVEGGDDIVIRFLGKKSRESNETPEGNWKIPSCFNVLTDLSDEERKDFDTVVAEPVKLSRHL